uniref:M91 family zinc metallopeptidase n=1 Tax=Spongiimicrobium sp. 3-5 TaxID=3332596 RepID=UPI00397FAD15
NGNMTSDLNKGIAAGGIEYNHLNLPTRIDVNTDNIQYIYDATGVKMRKTVSTGNTTDYAGNYVYENGALQFFGHPEGYVEPDGSGGYDYVYQYRDHLGSVRLSYQDTDNDGSVGQSEILQERNYYPFGLQHKGYNGNIQGAENDHMTYQGQEHEEELGKETYAFQWRDYDPAIARFNKIDRFAEKYYDKTPYHFAANNPIRFTEIAGDTIWINYKNEKIRYEDGKLYNRDGTAYNGKGLKTKKDGSTKLKGFLGKTVDALNSIRTGGDAGNELVGDLQDSGQHVFIGKGSNSTRGLRVSWNPSDKSGGPDQSGSTRRPSFIGLAHELGHAHDALDGVVDRSTWVTTSDGTAIPNAEIYASHWENRVRGENGLSLRTHYSIDRGTNLGGLLNNNGTSRHFSQSQTMPTIQFQTQGNTVDGTFRVVPVPGSSTMVLPYKYD